jgi:hypothetical protein
MSFSKRTKLGTIAGLALIFGAVNAAPSYAVHQTVTGLDTNNQIVQFAVGAPGTYINGPSSVTYPAGVTDTDLIGLDYRPRGGNLFAQGSQGSVYVLDPPAAFPGNWAATRVAAPNFNPFTGTPTSFGFDFNPTVDRIRTVNNDTTTNNFRFNPNSGQQVDFDTVAAGVQPDGSLQFAPADVNAGDVPAVGGAAYTNNIDGATTTTLYDIETGNDILATQNPPNNGTLNTVGSLGVPTTAVVGFDIESGTGTPYAALQPTGGAQSTFYRLDILTGAATVVGAGMIGPAASAPIDSLSLRPIPVLRFANATTSVSENGGTATVTVVREGPLNQTATVNYATSVGGGDTATSGTDFTSTSGMLTFAPGDASENITIPIANDSDDEPNETFTVTLSGPSTSANLAMSPMTTQVSIVDDEATPGSLVALVSIPFQAEKKVASSKMLKYSFSCDQECSVSSSLQLKNGTELATDTGAFANAGKSDETFTLDKADVKAIKNAKGKKSVPLKIVSTFTDGNANQQILTTKFKLDR